jgi:ankyrin repeat protein
MPVWIVVLVALLVIAMLVVAILELPPQHRFIDSAGEEDDRKLKQWLAKGRDVNGPGLLGLNALGVAVTEAKAGNVALLLQAGADPNTLSMKALPLQVAVENDDVEIARLLLKSGADLNRFGLFGTPLEDAVNRGRIKLLELFAEFGADFNAKTKDGDPLLVRLLFVIAGTRDLEAREGLRQSVRFLLDHGANPNARSAKDIPAVMAALEDPISLRMLVDAGAITQASFQGADLEPLIENALAGGEAGSKA